jgi:hypothetical protein
MTGTEIYPLRHGHVGDAPKDVRAMVCLTQKSWDGTNWVALRMLIVNTMPEGAREDLDTWTFSHIIQYFFGLKNRGTLKVGANSDTNNWSITLPTSTVIQTERISFSAPPVDRNSSYSMTELCSFIGCEDNETASKYLKAANIETATVGQRNFRLSYSNAVKFLEFVSQYPRVDLHKETAIKALESLKNPV